ncbi:unnamed protein product [Amoebophrya sp. A120]|nr:unnamed protein product [Amoebophrya sp. A120]|eukprot:GSA120T00003485001.1
MRRGLITSVVGIFAFGSAAGLSLKNQSLSEKKASLERFIEGYIGKKWEEVENGEPEPTFRAKVTEDGNLLVAFEPDQQEFDATRRVPYENYSGIYMHFKIVIRDPDFFVPEGWSILEDRQSLKVKMKTQPVAYAKYKTFHPNINNKAGGDGHCCFRIMDDTWPHYSLAGWIERLWVFLVTPDAGKVETPYDRAAQDLWKKWSTQGDPSYWKAVGQMAASHQYRKDLRFTDTIE